MAHEVPADLKFSSEVFDLAFHPTASIVAAATISGDVHVHEYGVAENKKIFSSSGHLESCRACTFSDDGLALFTASADKSVQMIDMATGKTAATLAGAHGCAINTMLTIPTKNVLATGDDSGCVKFWDLRQQKEITAFTEHGDYISDMVFCAEKGVTIASSGDGRISFMNFRSGKVQFTGQLEDEPLSLAVVKGANNLICGTQEGVLGVYKWGEWADVRDRVPGHPSSVDAIVKIDEDTLVTGCSDGLLRIVSVLPNKVRGVLGAHDGGFSVEKMEMSGDGRYIGSCSHDKLIKFWRVDDALKAASFAIEGDADDDDNDNDDDDDTAATNATEMKQDDDDGDISSEDWEDDDEMDVEDRPTYDYASAPKGKFFGDL
eukprot:m.113808 g.113808  ORF g.113808 m.113808 type:complete len:376 (-) comp28296_c0_seq1:106-1233(-)